MTVEVSEDDTSDDAMIRDVGWCACRLIDGIEPAGFWLQAFVGMGRVRGR